MTPEEIVMPVYVRVGETEGRWGTITLTAEDGLLNEGEIRRETAAFFRAAADRLENPGDDEDEGVPGAAP